LHIISKLQIFLKNKKLPILEAFYLAKSFYKNSKQRNILDFYFTLLKSQNLLHRKDAIFISDKFSRQNSTFSKTFTVMSGMNDFNIIYS
jgi:hypothetical protein